MKIKDLKADD